MSAHNILSELNAASNGAGKVITVIDSAATVPSGVAGFAIGCLLIKPGDGAYLNKGTLASCNFTKITQA